MGKIKLLNGAVEFFSAVCMTLSKDWRLKTNILFFLIFPVGKKSHGNFENSHGKKFSHEIFKLPIGFLSFSSYL